MAEVRLAALGVVGQVAEGEVHVAVLGVIGQMAEEHLADVVASQQLVTGSRQLHVTADEHVPVFGNLQRFGGALFDEQYGGAAGGIRRTYLVSTVCASFRRKPAVGSSSNSAVGRQSMDTTDGHHLAFPAAQLVNPAIEHRL